MTTGYNWINSEILTLSWHCIDVTVLIITVSYSFLCIQDLHYARNHIMLEINQYKKALPGFLWITEIATVIILYRLFIQPVLVSEMFFVCLSIYSSSTSIYPCQSSNLMLFGHFFVFMLLISHLILLPVSLSVTFQFCLYSLAVSVSPLFSSKLWTFSQ